MNTLEDCTLIHLGTPDLEDIRLEEWDFITINNHKRVFGKDQSGEWRLSTPIRFSENTEYPSWVRTANGRTYYLSLARTIPDLEGLGFLCSILEKMFDSNKKRNEALNSMGLIDIF